ncbi:MAG TPA: aminopeptidase P family N-terminal domain-containing protein, partial [Desulfuromonadales bacterium]|nr:aminopeptidase P family N-terminal domain-containing protein [Desulfuromonadales bacterium]
MVENRTRRVRQMLDQLGLTGFLFTSLPNIRYLCGFTGTDGALVVTADTDVFLTDSRYTEQAHRQVSVAEVREYAQKLEGVVDCLQASGAYRVGFEAETLSFATVERLKEKSEADIEWVPVGKEFQDLRVVKDADELTAIEEAAGLNAEAFEEILPLIRPGAV